MEGLCSPASGRLDRHVGRSFITAGRDVPLARVQFSLEQALRLAVLPGEEEGRIYCFRRVDFPAIAPEAHRQKWIERVQATLDTLAARAVHGAIAGAEQAEAVYFNNLEEALDVLLRRALAAGAGQSPNWFAVSLLGDVDATSWRALIPAVVERMFDGSRGGPASAAMIFSALDGTSAVPLLSAIPEHTFRRWLGPLKEGAARSMEPVRPATPLRDRLVEAAEALGWQHPAVIWLAAQAVICTAPAAWGSGSAALRAVATLAVLEQERRTDGETQHAAGAAPQRRNAIVFSEGGSAAAAPGGTADEKRLVPESVAESQGIPLMARGSAPADEHAGGASLEAELDVPLARPVLLGEWSQAGGLLFFLNVLRRMGMDEVMQTCPRLGEQDFASRILRLLAADAGVAKDDALLECIGNPPDDFVFDPALPDLARTAILPKWFRHRAERAVDGAYVLRAWRVAAKLWCRRNTGMPARDVICRTGRVWRTRTDLDVTFALALADVRIRRAGLDIDPGWLPWFGPSGCVVRFHYRDREAG